MCNSFLWYAQQKQEGDIGLKAKYGHQEPSVENKQEAYWRRQEVYPVADSELQR